MTLKELVDRELMHKKRSRSWLAREMEMTPDGLRLSLVRESIKYADIVRVCKILGVKAGVLFEEGEVEGEVVMSRNAPQNGDRFKDSEEMIRLLKALVKDKERIIALMSKQQ
jgi:hypothetical protein